MKKRLLSVLLCTAMVASMLIGCGGGTEEAPAEDSAATEVTGEFDWKNYEGTTINVMFNEHNYSKAVIAKLAEFEELTGITVEYTSTPETNYFDKLNTALSSRSGNPDVYMTGAYQVWEYAPAGYMEPLEDYLSNPALTSADYNEDDFMDGVYDALKWDLQAGHKVGEGSQWALPMGWELNNLSYNKRVFEEKGLECPTTTDELLETAQALQGFNGEGSYGIAIRGIRDWGTIHPGYMSLFATWGAEDFAIEDGKLVCKLDSEEAIAMTEYWVELAKTGSSDQWSTYTWVQCGVDLGAGKAAMMFDATSNAYFNNFEGASEESGNIAWGGVPLPEGVTEMKSNLWVWSLAMNADSQNKEAAWFFMQYFTSPDYMLWAGTEGASPDTPRQSVFDSEEYQATVGSANNYLEAFAALQDGGSIYFTPHPYFFEATTTWSDYLQRMVTTDEFASVEEGMKALKAELDMVVADLVVE